MTKSEAMDLVQEINMNLAENGEEACCLALDMAKRHWKSRCRKVQTWKVMDMTMMNR